MRIPNNGTDRLIFTIIIMAVIIFLGYYGYWKTAEAIEGFKQSINNGIGGI